MVVKMIVRRRGANLPRQGMQANDWMELSIVRRPPPHGRAMVIRLVLMAVGVGIFLAMAACSLTVPQADGEVGILVEAYLV